MPQSLVQMYLHIVFSTKHRMPFLADKTTRNRLYGYMAGICKERGCPALKIGGVEDHVHLLTRHSRTWCVSDFMRELKRSSTVWLKENYAELYSFHWQLGYGAFSVSHSHVERVRAYIANQEKNHESRSFQDEFRHLCRIHCVEFDERYVWD